MTPELWIRMIAALKRWHTKRLKHSAASRKGWAKPGARKNASDAGLKRWADAGEEERKRWTDAASDAVKRPEVRAILVEAQEILSADPDVRANKSESRKNWLGTKAGQKFRKRMKKQKTEEWDDPDKAAQMIEDMRTGNKLPEAFANRSKAAKEAGRSPGLRECRSDAVTESWAKLTAKEKKQRLVPMLEASHRPEIVKKVSDTHKNKFADPIKGPQLRAKMKEVADRPEVQKAVASGQRKGAAAILNAGRHREKPEIVDRALSLIEKKERMGQKLPSWTQIYIEVDPTEARKMNRQEVRAAGKNLRKMVDYWKKKAVENRFSPPFESASLSELSQEIR